MSPYWGIAVAVAGILTSLIWKLEWGKYKDIAFFFKFNQSPLWHGLDRFFILTRPLGTNWTLMIILVIVLIWRSQVGASLAIAALITAAIEISIKFIIKRPRPFSDLEDVHVRQNSSPQDPSFPSGDTTRVWFLFAAILFGIRPGLIWSVVAGFCAIVVSIGRIRLGVHYPTDIWSGAGLGFGMGMVWSSFFM